MAFSSMSFGVIDLELKNSLRLGYLSVLKFRLTTHICQEMVCFLATEIEC